MGLLKVLKPESAAVMDAEWCLAEIKTTASLQCLLILPLGTNPSRCIPSSHGQFFMVEGRKIRHQPGIAVSVGFIAPAR